MTTISLWRQRCREWYPEADRNFIENCGLVHFRHTYGNMERLKRIQYLTHALFDFRGIKTFEIYKDTCEWINLLVLAAVVLLSTLSIQVTKRTVIIIIVLLGLLKIPHVFDIGNYRHHDFVCYLQQASAFLDGETNYLKISSE